jgi:hypothetical protein
MHKIAIKELIEFNRKTTERGRKNYASKLKNRLPKIKAEDDDGSGGDYWVSSSSCIYNVFKYDKNDYYEDKIEDLTVKFKATHDKRIKSMYQRNMDILTSFKDFNFNDIRPAKISKFETVQKVHKVINLENFRLYLNPSILFVHERNGKTELGAIWLVAQLGGFKKQELGVFCEILHNFLTKNYSDNYQISDDLCIAIDTFNVQKVDYSELTNGNVPLLLRNILSEIKQLN